jgi:hypothetical protein
MRPSVAFGFLAPLSTLWIEDSVGQQLIDPEGRKRTYQGVSDRARASRERIL